MPPNIHMDLVVRVARREVTQTLPIRNFCYRQHVKYIGHVCRLDNNARQKQVFFNIKAPKKVWSKIRENRPLC